MIATPEKADGRTFTLDRQKVLDALTRVSGFSSASAKTPRTLGIGTALREIASVLYADKITAMRTLLKNNPATYSEAKKTLPAFVWGGEFSGRGIKSLLKPSGVLCLDFDHLQDVDRTFDRLTADPYVWFAFISPSGAGIKAGFHANGIGGDDEHKKFFRAAANYVQITHGLMADESGKDISRLCFVSCDPLIYVADNPQDFDIEKWLPAPKEAKVYQLPGEKIDSVRRRYGTKVLETCCSKIASAPLGERNSTRIKYGRLAGGFCASGCMDEGEALTALLAAAESNTQDPPAARRDIEGAFADGLKNPLEPELRAERCGVGGEDKQPEIKDIPDDKIRKFLFQNQAGDASLFRELFVGKYLYDHADAIWFRWCGHYYEPDRTQAVINDFSAVVRAYAKYLTKVSAQVNEAAQSGQKNPGAENLERALRKRVEQLQTFRRVLDVLNFAKSFPDMATDGNQWDSDPLLFCCQNGVIDLRTGDFRAGKPDDMCRRHSEVAFDPAADCPAWNRFLSEILVDEELVQFMQRLCGYMITGETREEVFPIFFGHGANGKTKFVEALKGVMSAYAGTLSVASLMKTGQDQAAGAPRADIAKLAGKRLVSASESDEGHRLNVGFVKNATGGDALCARSPFGRHEVDFTPSHKLVMLTNFKPKVPPDDFALWRRILLVPFNMSFVDAPKAPNERKKDDRLAEKLKAEYPGILAWCVEGCREWQRRGLCPPDSVINSTSDYRRENDSISDFITACCQLSGSVQIKVMFDAYTEFCEQAGIPHVRINQFSGQLSMKFDRYTQKRKSFFMGVSLKDS